MSSPCVTEQDLRQMLAGHLSVAEEAPIAEHLQVCPDCERLAAQLGDDPLVRDLLVLQRDRGTIAADPSLVELRTRLCALGDWSSYDAGPRNFVRLSTGAESRGPGGSSTRRNTPLSAAIVAKDTIAPQPQQLGPFTILRALGAGAFGVVYLARDTRLGREVALKLPRATVLTDPDLKERFLREAEALARLDHPNIVPVFEVGEHREPGQREGTCYLAIAFCDGPTLADWLGKRDAPVAVTMAARLVLQLADAVAHAHERQILHRDIKPGNVLLDRVTAGSDLPFTPRLTDFGLAKVAEAPSTATLGGMVLGTPQYMAPEQAAGHAARIGPATDVYALGAMLYELLTDRPPIQGNSSIDTLRRVLIDDPAPVRSSRPDAPDDLAAIAMKCLDKSPARRYASAADLAADLRRFLNGRPTVARPVSPTELLARWVRRNPGSSTAIALTLLVLVLGAGILFYDQRLKVSQARAEAAAQKSSLLQQQIRSSDELFEDLSYVNGIRTAALAIDDSDLSQAATILRGQIPAPGERERRGVDWHYLWARTTHEALDEIHVGTQVYQLRLSDDGKQLAAACEDGIVRIYDPGNKKRRAQFAANQGELNGVTFDPTGKLLATAGDKGSVKVWRLSDREATCVIQAFPALAYSAQFVNDAQSLLTIGSEPDVGLWDLNTGASSATLKGHTKAVEAVELSPDKTLLATASSDNTVIVWDTSKWRPVYHLGHHQGRLTSVAFSPDGEWLATGSLDQRVFLYATGSGKCVGIGTHLDAIQSLTFTSTSGRLISGDRAGTIRVWRVPSPSDQEGTLDLTRDNLDAMWHAHQGKVWSLVALPDSDGFASTGSEDKKIRFWGHRKFVSRTVRKRGNEGYHALRPTADGKQLYALTSAGIDAIDPQSGRLMHSLPGEGDKFSALALLERHNRIVAGTTEGSLVLWDAKTLKRVARREMRAGEDIDRLVYSAEADRLAMMSEADEVLLVDPASLEIVGRLPAEAHNAVAFSPDGRQIAVDTQNRIAIYDVQTCRLVHRFLAHLNTIKSLAWSPDGTLIASGSADRSARLWTPTGELVATLSGHRHLVSSVAFSHDGKVLVSGDMVGSVHLTHVATRRTLFSTPTDSQFVREIALLPGGRQIALRNMNDEVVILGTPANASEGVVAAD